MNPKESKDEIVDIKGMRCKSCAEKIEAKLSRLEGVDRARVSFVEEKAYVSFDPTQVALNIIKTEIESIGYKTDLNTKTGKSLEKGSIKQGIIYGLIPHTGCIAFIIASILGATVATQLFKPLLLNPYFFYILILLSFILATISAIIYLGKQGFITFNKGKHVKISFSSKGIKRKWRYLSTLYGTTICINLLLFMVIFPLVANLSASPNLQNTGNRVLTLQVEIPCPGHAPLIRDELMKITGVSYVKYNLPNYFDVTYDAAKVTKDKILSLDVFSTYKATVINETSVPASSNILDAGNLNSTRVQL